MCHFSSLYCMTFLQFRRIYLFLFLLFFADNLDLTLAEDNLGLPPKSTSIKPIQLPEYKSFTLENGLQVYLIENHKLPTVSFFLYLDYLGEVEKAKYGLGEFTASLIKQGAKKRTKFEIDEELDFMGSELGVQSNFIFANSLIRYSEKTLEILSDIVMYPNFEEAEFARTKEEMLAKIKSDQSKPDSTIENIAKHLLYPHNHPYREVPTEKTIHSIKLSDCKNYHKKYYRSNIAHLAIIGSINLEEAKRLAKKYFSSWEKQKLPKTKKYYPSKSKKTKIYLFDRKDSTQSVVKVTHNIYLPPGDKNIHSATVMNTILGGGIFRLYQNLREKHGYTYGVYSSFHPDKLTGNFSIDLSTENSVTSNSIQEIVWELNRIRKYEVTEKELQLAKNYLIGQFSLSLENPETIALFAIKSSIYHLPPNYFQSYIEKINHVSKKDVLKVAQKYIKPQRMYILIVGNKKELIRKLKKIRNLEVLEINQRGEKIKKG